MHVLESLEMMRVEALNGEPDAMEPHEEAVKAWLESNSVFHPLHHLIRQSFVDSVGIMARWEDGDPIVGAVCNMSEVFGS